MPQPRLLHPILCTIEQIDHNETVVIDPILKQPIGRVGRASTVQVYGQIADKNSKKVSMQEGGRVEVYDGYVLFRTLDLQAASISLNIGDRITEIGEGANVRVQNLYIVSLAYEGHYPSATGATLVKAFYQDRHPSRN